MTYSAAEVARAAADQRLLPRWSFVGVGPVLWILIAYRRGAYLVDERTKAAVALHSPLPGTMAPVIAALMLWHTAAYVIVGTFVPTSALPL